MASPALKDLNTSNITRNTNLINSHCQDPRVRYLLERLVTHLHDFARETRLSTSEWSTALSFLTDVGKTTTPLRNEFILLSDVLGLSLLVDAIDHPKPADATEGTVLGPFHTHDAQTLEAGATISHDEAGEAVLVIARVRDRTGRPLGGVKVDVWETDSSGHYDVQYAERGGPDGRGVLYSDETAGEVWFRAIKPVSYPIPHDGPVGKLLKLMKRHPYRPAHMHFMFEKEGFDHLITSLYMRGDPYEASDAVFGVKSSLVVDLSTVTDSDMAAKYGVPVGTALLEHDFVLVSDEETRELRDKNSVDALAKLGWKVSIVNGLPVPEVD